MPRLKTTRRALLQTAAATTILPAAARADSNPITIGHIDSVTGTFAVNAVAQIAGANFAAAELNAKGGILGRPVQINLADDAGAPATGLAAAAKLITQDNVDFLMGVTSSAVALAVSQFAASHNKIFICTGGHADKITGAACNWATFRVCSSALMLTKGNAKTLFDKYGKKWYFFTSDYANGHSGQKDYTAELGQLGGSVAGASIIPLGTKDFSPYFPLVKAAAPDALILVLGGQDQVTAMEQITQAGLNKTVGVGGSQFEFEQIAALPPAARYGIWSFEWYWNQPGVPHVADFVAAYTAANAGKYPSERSWFGYVSVHALALACQAANSTDSAAVAKALEGLTLPPEIALQPGAPAFRAADHQLLLGMFPGQVNQNSTYPNLLTVFGVVPGAAIAPPSADCTITYPS